MVTKRLAVILVFTLLSLGAAACGGGGGGTTTLPEDPKGAAEVAGFHDFHSGNLEIILKVNRNMSGHPEKVEMRMTGPFTKADDGGLPEVSMGIESHGLLDGQEIDYNTAVTLLRNQLGFTYGPTEAEKTYRVDKEAFEKLKSDLEDAQGEGGEGDAGSCLEAAGDFHLSQILQRASFEGTSETLDGTKLTVVGADLDLPAAIEQLIELSSDPACGAQLEAIGVPPVPPVPQLEKLGKQLQDSVAESRVTLGLDKQARVRSLKAVAKVELPHEDELEVELSARLDNANEAIEMPIPEGMTPFASLLKKFGVDTQTLEEADGDEVFLSFLEVTALGVFGHDPP
ncbi:MAG TPA: hypothetical protein VNN15_05240 [Solirubrobacterales bacterium]|nr:hypothetical protein [Solirubrobacterales bacterium]